MDLCALCQKSLHSGEKTVIPTQKGRDTINRASKERGDTVHITAHQEVHEHCRRVYTNKNSINSFLKNKENENPANVSQALRSQGKCFDFRKCCLFCGEPVKLDATYGPQVWPVRTYDFQDSILSCCKERADEWSEKVRGRLNFVSDLPAAGALYHQSCSVNFRTKRKLPVVFSSEYEPRRKKKGRPVDDERADAFKKVVEYLQANDTKQITINDLITKMKEYAGGDAYASKKMKEELKKYFGEDLIITTEDGKPNLTTFRKTASSILHTLYSTPSCENEEVLKETCIRAAGELIKSDIKTLKESKEHYPSSSNISSLSANLDFVPNSLKLLLGTIFCGQKDDIKIASIGQAILQAACPRLLIAPLQIGLGVQMHHCFASQFLVDVLHSLGFCSSYKEVRTYEYSAAIGQEVKIPTVDTRFVQFMADNVDHNTATLDGLGTFHGMGIMAAITPNISNNVPLPRKKDINLQQVVEKAKIDIKFYMQDCVGLKKIKFEKLQVLQYDDPTKEVEALWKASWLLNSDRPSWSGFMQTVHKGEFPGQSSIMFLPMIDINPGDKTCIYSTLLYICDLAKRYNQTPILTFDQPLWWKALAIIESEHEASDLHSIILRLGPFHMQMSFLACIGHLMEGTGLHEILSTVYGKNAVSAMLQGKAVTRAVRGHILVDAALNALITSIAFKVPVPNHQKEEIKQKDLQKEEKGNKESERFSSNDEQAQTILEEMQMLKSSVRCTVSEKSEFSQECTDTILAGILDLHKKLIDGQLLPYDLKGNGTILKMVRQLKNTIASLSGRTSTLWLQYMTMVDILKKFIKAERTGNWHLHLSTSQSMLPYLAAAGHNLYTKSAYIYLQNMSKLEKTHPKVYQSFSQGFHVVRQSNRFWAGLSSDLAIEQILMKNVKSAGGLTRGRGIGESQRAMWILSKPSCAEVNNAMQNVTGTMYLSSEQHKELGPTRVAKDAQDMLTITTFLQQRNPFSSEDQSLRNICSGTVADSRVNVDAAEQVGFYILKKLEGQSVSDVVLKKTDKAVTMSVKSTVIINGEMETIDSQLLFQRLIAAANHHYKDKREIFKYELCSYPSALFESTGVFQQPSKASLADELWKMVSSNATSDLPTGNIQFVLDGGSLLHRFPWHRGITFQSIIKSYITYITKNYQDAVVVFDGYMSGPSTKNVTQLKRCRRLHGQAVHFTLDMVLHCTKEEFLSNKENKQRFIKALGAALENEGLRVIHAESDADLTIVQTATEYAKVRTTAVIGEDTDLLVLLAHHTDPTSYNIFFYSERTNSKKRLWNMQHMISVFGEARHLLLFLHAMTGCDTTSRPFGIGKRTALRKLMNCTDLSNLANVFLEESKQEDICTAGEKVLVLLYKGQSSECLDALRHRIFCMKVAAGTACVQVHSLPPTSAAAKFHSQRVYLQVQEWMGKPISPLNWGWKLEGGVYVPVMTDLPPAPDELLKIIRCKCKENCENRRCICRKHGLACSPACGECHGISCSNSTKVLMDEDETDTI